MPPFQSVCLIGLGLIGSSISRAVREHMPAVRLIGYDAEPEVRGRAAELELVDFLANDPGEAVREAELVILCVPVGAIEAAARAIADNLSAGCVVSDVGSSKAGVAATLKAALPNAIVIPAHPVAGTENSGPDAGFASLFSGRWCILAPGNEVEPSDRDRMVEFWEQLGAKVEIMDAEHHDLVLAVTSHLPHLIAFTIVGTASDLEEVTKSEVIKYSAGGFRDFTRIAASNPIMWRDIFLSNKAAVLDMLQRFGEDLTTLQRAIRRDDGEVLLDLFTRTRAIRRSVVEHGQDVSSPDFGRPQVSSREH